MAVRLTGACLVLIALTASLAGCSPAGSELPATNADGSKAAPTTAAPLGGLDTAATPGAHADLMMTGPSNVSVEIADENDYQRLLEKYRGKVVLVDFWATWCGPCTEQFPHTVDIYHKYQPQGLAVISMSLDDESSRQEVTKFLQDKGAVFDNRMSKYGVDVKSFEVFDLDGGAVPHYKLYDTEGKLVKKFFVDPTDTTPFTPEEIELAIKELLVNPAGG